MKRLSIMVAVLFMLSGLTMAADPFKNIVKDLKKTAVNVKKASKEAAKGGKKTVEAVANATTGTADAIGKGAVKAKESFWEKLFGKKKKRHGM
jgi:hypothetical protein